MLFWWSMSQPRRRASLTTFLWLFCASARQTSAQVNPHKLQHPARRRGGGVGPAAVRRSRCERPGERAGRRS